MGNKSIESEVIDLLRLPLCIGVVFLHTYTNTQTVAWLNEGKPLYQNICYIFSLGFGEIGVPLFFFISGYLFFRNTKLTFDVYRKKVKSRMRSLLLPYLFWNFFFIALFFIAEHLPVISQYFSGVNKRVSDYTWIDFLRAFWDRGDWQGGNSVPFDWPLWFVRNLICLVILSPVVKYFVIYGRIWGIGILAFFWLTSNSVAFTVTSGLFFSLGAYFSLVRKQLLVSQLNVRYLAVGLYPLLFAVDYFTRGIAYHIVIHRIAILAGVFWSIYLTAWLTEHWSIRGKAYLGPLSFFMYVVHDPLLHLVRKLTVKLVPMASDGLSVVLYFGDAFLVIGLIVLFFILLKKYLPGFLALSVGGRS